MLSGGSKWKSRFLLAWAVLLYWRTCSVPESDRYPDSNSRTVGMYGERNLHSTRNPFHTRHLDRALQSGDQSTDLLFLLCEWRALCERSFCRVLGSANSVAGPAFFGELFSRRGLSGPVWFDWLDECFYGMLCEWEVLRSALHLSSVDRTHRNSDPSGK